MCTRVCVSGCVWVDVDVHMSVSMYTCMCEWACMKNRAIITNGHLQINQILALDNP